METEKKVQGQADDPGDPETSIGFDIDAEMAEINGEDGGNIKFEDDNDGENLELNGYVDYDDDGMEDLKQHIEALCNQKIPKGRFTPTAETVTAWKTVISTAYDHPNILKHPDLKPLYQLFLIMGIRLEGDGYEIRIKVGDRPKNEADCSNIASSESNGCELLNANGNGVVDPKISNGMSSGDAFRILPVQLMLGGLDNMECDYDFKSRTMTIKNYNILPGIKDHVSQILIFLLTDPHQLFTPGCEFLVDFLTHFGVNRRSISTFVELVKELNGLKPNFSRTHRAIKLWMNTPSVAREKKMKERQRGKIMTEVNNNNQKEKEKHGYVMMRMTAMRQLNELMGLTGNDMVNYSPPPSPSVSDKIDENSGHSGESDGSTSDDDGFTGKRKRKKKFRRRKKFRTAAAQHSASAVPLSLHPRFRTLRSSTTGIGGNRNGPSGGNESSRKSRFSEKMPGSAIHNRRKIENDEKPIGCPSITACPVRFLYKYTVLKHFSKQHPNETLPPEFMSQLKSTPEAVNGFQVKKEPGTKVQKSHRFSVENDKKPIACASATGCTVRFMYQTTMMKHFRGKHPNESLNDHTYQPVAPAVITLVPTVTVPAVTVKKEKTSRNLLKPAPVDSIDEPPPPLKLKPNSVSDSKGQDLGKYSKYRIPNGHKPVACASTNCPVRFTVRKNMIKHFRQRHPDEPLPYLNTTPKSTNGANGLGLKKNAVDTAQKSIKKLAKHGSESNATEIKSDGKYCTTYNSENGPKEKPFCCPSKTGCGIRFLFKSSMKRHFRGEHADEERLPDDDKVSAKSK